MCLEGDEAALSELHESFCARARSFLLRAGAPSQEANEIIGGLCGDCLSHDREGSPRLARYAGRSSLQTWLNHVALNALIDRKRRDERWRQLVPAGLTLEGGIDARSGELKPSPTTIESAADAPLLELMRGAIEAAFAECAAEDFVMLQLAHSDGLRLVELARMFDCGIATISRRLERASGEIAAATLAHIAAVDPWLDVTWEDFLELCRSATPAWFGVE